MRRAVDIADLPPPDSIYGLIVSQEVYDGLRAKVPQSFEGGNCFRGVPIVVDPDLEPGAVDIAFNLFAWQERLRAIRDRGRP